MRKFRDRVPASHHSVTEEVPSRAGALTKDQLRERVMIGYSNDSETELGKEGGVEREGGGTSM